MGFLATLDFAGIATHGLIGYCHWVSVFLHCMGRVGKSVPQGVLEL